MRRAIALCAVGVWAGCHTLLPFGSSQATDGAVAVDAAQDSPATDGRPPADRGDERVDSARPPTIWARRFGGTDQDFAGAVALDSSGNVFVTGAFNGTESFGGSTSYSGQNQDVFVASYDGQGKFRWAKAFGGSGADQGRGIAVDGASVYVTGYFTGSVNFAGVSKLSSGMLDTFLLKLNAATGALEWVRAIGGPGHSDFGSAVVVDPAHNLFLVGAVDGSSVAADLCGPTPALGLANILVARYDAGGACQWIKALGGAANETGLAVAVDSSSNVHVTGYVFGTVDLGDGKSRPCTGPADAFVASYSGANGALRWGAVYGGDDVQEGTAIAVDSNGVHVTGVFRDTINFGGSTLTSLGLTTTDIFVASFQASSGAHRWSKRFGSLNDDRGSGLAVGGNGTLYLTGSFTDTVGFGGSTDLASQGNLDIMVVRLASSNGAHVSSVRYGGPGYEEGTALAPFSGGLFLAGIFNSAPLPFTATVSISPAGTDLDGFLARLPP